MGERKPQWRWWLTITCTVTKRHVIRTVIVAETLGEAERKAIQMVRTRRLTDRAGVPWDGWTLLARADGHGPIRIVAIGTADRTTWTQRDQAPKGFGHGRY